MPKSKPKQPKVVILRVNQKPTLDELISRITPENRHPEMDWGLAVGKEIW